MLDEVFRTKLKTYSDKLLIADLLTKTTLNETHQYIIGLKDDDLKELGKILEAVLKGVEFVSIQLASFKPATPCLWGDEEIQAVVTESEDFLRDSAKGKVVKIAERPT